MRFVLIAAGGALGAVLRYLMSEWTSRLLGSGYPWGTLSVNLAGSMMIGFLWAASEKAPLPPGWSFFLFAGLLGAFTTYSTFALETVNLWRDGEMMIALVNMLISSVGSVLLAAAGLLLGRYIFGA